MIIFVLAFLYQSAYHNDYTERGEFTEGKMSRWRDNCFLSSLSGNNELLKLYLLHVLC